MSNNILDAVNEIYSYRTNFTIIALTGQTATGRSRLASFMANKDFINDSSAYVRKPDTVRPTSEKFFDNSDIHIDGNVSESNRAIASMVFSKKYNICYKFIAENYEPFIIIKYTHVLWLFSLLKIRDKLNNEGTCSDENFKREVFDLFEDKYCPSIKDNVDVEYKELCKEIHEQNVNTYNDCTKIFEDYSDWQTLYNQLNEIDEDFFDNISSSSEINTDKLIEVFSDMNGAFCSFVKKINTEFPKLDYYSLCFMYHRLGVVARNTGNPLTKSQESYDRMGNDSSHIYDVVKIINLLIKGYHKIKNPDGTIRKKQCRVVIDSIRNSMEALFFKERYSSFYMIAVHDDENTEKHLRDKLEKQYADFQEPTVKQRFIDEQIKCVLKLGRIEAIGKEVEKGKFASPNVSQCITDSEIHISNTIDLKDNNHPQFISMAEQWMKYAALIQHPGLITPSSEERCMEVAFSAKFNSGCLSRQVGAVITNKYHAIRTIGWNDVPYGHMPCALRELSDLVSSSASSIMFSSYERNHDKVFDGNYSFIERVKMDYPNLLEEEYRKGLKGLPLSYCFKSLQNKYDGEKNQVYTRSLHAEENAMMQMVKFGGESLMDGVIYVTSSPCDLCCKKLYQIGVRKIVYIDEYPGISRPNIIENGFKRPTLKQFQGAYGITYYKLFQPFMAYKDELSLRTQDNSPKLKSSESLLKDIMTVLGREVKTCYSEEDYDVVLSEIKKIKGAD